MFDVFAAALRRGANLDISDDDDDDARTSIMITAAGSQLQAYYYYSTVFGAGTSELSDTYWHTHTLNIVAAA